MSSIVFSSPPPGWRSCGRPWWPCSSWTRTWAACARGWLTSRPSCRGPSSMTPATTRRFRGNSASSRQVGAALPLHPKLSAMEFNVMLNVRDIQYSPQLQRMQTKESHNLWKGLTDTQSADLLPGKWIIAQPRDSGWSRWKSVGQPPALVEEGRGVTQNLWLPGRGLKSVWIFTALPRCLSKCGQCAESPLTSFLCRAARAVQHMHLMYASGSVAASNIKYWNGSCRSQ